MTPDEAHEKLAPASIDVILAAEVLEHVEPLRPTIERFIEWLKPSGRLLVSLPTENTLYRMGRRLAGFDGHYHHSHARSIDGDLQRWGFRRERLERIPLPGPLSIYWAASYVLAS
jgi:predicted SAM-dependent methyltransferase